MNSTPGLVSRILAWSVVDGPGNRLTVFLQGCNYACLACHNPHTKGQCDHCGLCVPACPTAALRTVDGRVVFEPALCTHCDACLDACPIHANPMAQEMSVGDVLDIARQNLPFLTGVTVSGGEATMQAVFVRDLFAAIKADPDLRRLTCLIDSNGHMGEAGWEKLLPVTDGVLLDIKAFDPALHRALSGRDNDRALASARYLAARGKLAELRFLMIPGKTDNAGEIDRLIAFVRELGDVPIRLNAFRTHGVRGAAMDWPKMPREGVEAAATRLRTAGIAEVATPAVWV